MEVWMAKESKNIRDFQQAAVNRRGLSMSPADFGVIEGPPVPKRSQQLGCSFGGASWLKPPAKDLIHAKN